MFFLCDLVCFVQVLLVSRSRSKKFSLRNAYKEHVKNIDKVLPKTYANTKSITSILRICDGGSSSKVSQECWDSNWPASDVSSGFFVMLMQEKN